MYGIRVSHALVSHTSLLSADSLVLLILIIWLAISIAHMPIAYGATNRRWEGIVKVIGPIRVIVVGTDTWAKET